MLFFAALSMVLAALFFFLPSHPRQRHCDAFDPRQQPSVSFASLGQGAMSLTLTTVSSLVPDLSSEIIVLAKNSRPDASLSTPTFLLSLKGSTEKKVAAEGEQLFIDSKMLVGSNAHYGFSSKRTPLWMRLAAQEGAELRFEVGQFSAMSDGEGFSQHTGQVVIVPMEAGVTGTSSLPCAEPLRSAKAWGGDALFKQYGGAEYQPLALCCKVELHDGSGLSLLFLSEGDLLQWDGNLWYQVQPDAIERSRPIAKVVQLNQRSMEIDVWDESGFFPEHISLAMQKGASPKGRQEIASSTVVEKVAGVFTFSIGKRRYALSEGDWMVKVGKGWRVLRRSKDIDDCLMHKIRGELFIFDAAEMQQGKKMIKGFIFDEMRTQMQAVSVAAALDNAGDGKKKGVARQPSSSRSRSTAKRGVKK